MKIETYRFGVIEIEEEKIITFKEGLPGFEHLKKFVLLDSKEKRFNYLQSIEDKMICFIIIDPYTIKEDYAPIISEEYFEKLGGGNNDEFMLYCIVCFREPMEESTINLAGPLLIHVENRQGIQVITEEKKYQTRHNLVELIKGGEGKC